MAVAVSHLRPPPAPPTGHALLTRVSLTATVEPEVLPALRPAVMGRKCERARRAVRREQQPCALSQVGLLVWPAGAGVPALLPVLTGVPVACLWRESRTRWPGAAPAPRWAMAHAWTSAAPQPPGSPELFPCRCCTPRVGEGAGRG